VRPRSLDIVVPVLNEGASIDEFHDRVARLGCADALLFVDNASSDDTVARVEAHGSRLVRHAMNEGYGASIRDGIAASDAELVIVIDADLEYPPEAIPAILEALRAHPVVYASRFLGGVAPDMPLLRRLGNRLVSALFNVLYRQRTTDLYTGMKGLRRSALPLEQLRRSGFEHCAELAALITVAGLTIHEVPIDYRPRQRGRSKMRHVPETAKLVAHLVRYWVRCIVLGRPLPGEPSRFPPTTGVR
jgi:glycosyltransferase involved in cell wall biosynthesis